MKNILVDYDRTVISVSSAFAKKAFTYGTREYDELNRARRDYPDFSIEIRQFKTNQKQDHYKGLTYDYMRNYIVTKDNEHAVEMLSTLDDMIGISKCHSKCKRYPTIKAWFLNQYPAVAQFGMDDPEAA